MQITYDKPFWASAKGKTGWINTIALDVKPVTWDHTEAVMIEPVSSRGTAGSCTVIVPLTAVPALIDALSRAIAAPVPLPETVD